MIILLIILLGFVLRIINLDQSLWLDEAISVLAIRNLSLWDVIFEYSKVDFHPPGYFIVLWVWTHLFNNYSEVWIRLPSIFAGLLAIFFTFLIGKKIGGYKIGIISAVLLAVNPLHVYYSQEARMYSIALLGVLVNFLMYLKFLNNEKRSDLYYSLTLPLIFMFDYLPYFIFPAYFAQILFFHKKNLRRWYISVLPSIALVVIWSVVFIPQLVTGIHASESITGWKAVVGGADFKQLLLVPIKFMIGRVSISDKVLYLFVVGPILGYGAYLILNALRSMEKDVVKKWMIFWTCTLALPFLVSFFIPVFSYFRLLYLVPFFCLFLAIGVLSFKKWKIASGLIFLIFSLSSFFYLLNPTFHREDWKGLVSYSPENMLIESNGFFAPLEYYYLQKNIKNNLAIPALGDFPVTKDEDILIPGELTEGGQRVYYLEYLADIADPYRLLQKKIESLGYKRVSIKNFNGIGFLYEYKR